MLRISLLIAVMIFVGLSCEIYAQDAGQRTRELAAALDKTKYKKKDKPNISIEFYIDIKNEPALRSASEYAGKYEADDQGYTLDLRYQSGAVSGSGTDIIAGREASFTLKDTAISGALLTATKVYSNGEQRPFEAVFVNRTVSTGKNSSQIESQDTKFGLGFIQTASASDADSNWTNRVFLMRR
jgi:hypothetical protein